MSTESIPCPRCGGDAQLECGAGCPGDDPGCVVCGGASPYPCECKTGEVERPAYCALCYEDDLCATEEPKPNWLEHPVFSADSLGQLYRWRRLSLDECDRSFCEACAVLVGLEGSWTS